MEEMDIFDKVLIPLKDNLDFPEALSFKVEVPSILKGHQRADIALKVEQKDSNLYQGFNKNSIDSKLIGKNFLVEIKTNTEPRFLRNAIYHIKNLIPEFPEYYPMIISIFIGPGGRELLRKEEISYMDTIGNIGLFLKDGFILIESKESIKKESKELKSLFAPKSSRVIRIMLENSSKSWRFEELSNISVTSIGQVHKVIKKLENEELIKKDEEGIKLSRPSELLNRWSSTYNIIQENKTDSYYISENSNEKIIEKLVNIASKEKFTYSFTLFAGANMIIPYIRTQQIHLYLSGNKDEFVKKSGLKPVTSGGNVHIITPYDEGIFNPIQTINKIKVVGNIQLYLDLVNYPARGKEQAEILREKIIGF
jgi:hypothetical protein